MSRPSPSPSDRGPTWLLLAWAALPFVIKGATAAAGLGGYAWHSTYKLAQLAAPVFWRRKYEGKRGLAVLWPVDERLPAARTWGLAVGVALLLAGTAIAAVSVLAKPLGIDPRALREGFDARFVLSPLGAVLVVVYLLSLNAGLEELHFRVWLDRNLSQRWGSAAGIVISAATFAAMHGVVFFALPNLPGVGLPLIFTALVAAGASWSGLARLPGGIHAAWLSHGLTDALLLTWGLFWLGYF